MRARKVDATQQDIVDALRHAGALVWVINGTVDLLVQWRDRLVLIDSKSQLGRRTQAQQEMVNRGWLIHFCESPLQAYEAVGIPPRMRA